ncbi:hypothetical protein [Vibrio nomapromontoriensis]|uniref:hypothetical protein n=1 Tax=Vibrio nomapromontoriensis TaxID=2910246 RepID=UPI003D0A4756
MNISQSNNQSSHSYVYQYEVSPNISIPYIHHIDRTDKISSISGYASIQYGATEHLSPFVILNATYRELLSTKNNSSQKSTSGDFENYTLGASYQFRTFQPFNILTASYSKTAHAQTPSIGLLSNWIFDPIVLSLNARYMHSSYSKGYSLDNLAINSSLSFAVNPEITIRGGISNKFEFSSENSFLQSSEVNLGAAMNLTESITASTGVKFSVSGIDKYSYDIRFTFKV